MPKIVSNTIKEPGFMRYFSIVEKLKKEVVGSGLEYNHLGKGDFDHDQYTVPYLAKHILESSLKANYFPYSHPSGKEDTRKLLALVENLSLDSKQKYSYDDISLTIGATHALHSILSEITSPEKNKVVIFEPTYISHIEVIENLKCKPCLIDLDSSNEFMITDDTINQIEEKILIDSSISSILLINPSFPFGKYVPKDALKKILRLAEKYGIYLIIDEAYLALNMSDISYRDRSINKKSDNLIKIRTFSKTLTLSGIRLGYILCNKKLNVEISRQNEYTIGCPPTWLEPLIDFYSLSLLDHRKDLDFDELSKEVEYSSKKIRILEPYIKDLKEFYYDSRKIKLKLKEAMGQISTYLDREDIFSYIFPDAGINMGISINSEKNDMELMKELFINTGVVLTPGSIFSVKEPVPWFRLTFASDIDQVIKGLKLIASYMKDTYGD